MLTMRVVNRTRGTILGGRVRIADDALSRARGFLFRPRPEPGEGLLLSPCQAVHMFWMRFALDVVFIGETGRVVAVHPDLRPWRWTPVYREALHALELPAGTILATGTRTGDELSWARTLEEPDPAEKADPDTQEDTQSHTRRPA
jgi:uncharacterized membrane protein (UPF0127 family)